MYEKNDLTKAKMIITMVSICIYLHSVFRNEAELKNVGQPYYQ